MIRRGFGGRRVSADISIREAILREFARVQTQTPGYVHLATAWSIARRINALGSSVSSTMFKMATRGELLRGRRRSTHHGRYYSLPHTARTT